MKSSVSFESLKIVLNSSRISPCMKTFPDFEELTLKTLLETFDWPEKNSPEMDKIL